ncbi:MAG TPA: ATP-binding protein [Lichenihabitans sp.]|jgi:type II secretory pathway predicted ATPase ExeA|nr:ATP-binding protein [Lichenihabitans sp.]
MMDWDDLDRWRHTSDWRREEEEAAARELHLLHAFSKGNRSTDDLVDEAMDLQILQDRFEMPFIETSVASIVLSTIYRCRRFGQNGLIIGAPGVGKTRALEKAIRNSEDGEGPPVALVTVTGVIGASTMALFDEVAPHLGVKPATSIAATQRRLMKHTHFTPVLLFDEAQHLTNKSVRELLFISEKARVQMVFCGNADVLKLVSSRQAAIAQVSRRIPIREQIDCIDDDDADKIANHFGVEGMDGYRLCRRLGNSFHADGIAKVLSTARDRLASGRKTIQSKDIREALALFPHFAAGIERASSPDTAKRQSTMRQSRLGA